MSDSTTARPRPKPRRLPITKSSPKVPSLTSAAGTEITAAQRQRELDEEDALFLRNKSRSTQYWKRMEKANKELGRSSLGCSDDEGSELSPRSRKHKKKSNNVLPNWTENDDIVRLLSEDLDDDVLQEVEDERRTDRSPSKRQRMRSRSRSITPPPALSIQSLQNARNLVRQTLDAGRRSVSPTLVEADDSTDTIALDPELARIARDVRSQPSQNSFISETTGGPEVVTIKVKWQPHPLNEAGQSSIWGFKIKRNDTFRQVFEETADLAHVLSDHLIVSFGGKRVFSSTTPNSLKIWAEGELAACDRTTHDYVRAHRDQRQRSLSVTQEDEGNSSDAGSSDEAEATSTCGDTFKLVLRSTVTTKDITLTVRPTTTCGAVVEAFLKTAKLADKYPGTISGKKGKKNIAEPMLKIDGDKMDPMAPIGDADLEDGDMVEVVGL